MTEEDAYHIERTGPSVDFEYPDDETLKVLAVFTALLAWAGASRARHAVIPVLLKQRKATQGELARSVVVSPAAICKAMKEGQEEIERLRARRPI